MTASFVSAAAVAIGSLGPWETWSSPTAAAPEGLKRYGVSSSGLFTLLFAVLACAALLAAVRGWDLASFAWVAVALFGLCAITGLFEWLLIADRPASSSDESQAGWGMITVGLAGLCGMASAYHLARAIDD
jgi:hypothetical protein